jgi:hypothetical protein
MYIDVSNDPTASQTADRIYHMGSGSVGKRREGGDAGSGCRDVPSGRFLLVEQRLLSSLHRISLVTIERRRQYVRHGIQDERSRRGDSTNR